MANRKKFVAKNGITVGTGHTTTDVIDQDGHITANTVIISGTLLNATAFAGTANNASYLEGSNGSYYTGYSDNKAANAYSNATTYASNASNITTGTLTANVLATSGVTANTYGNSSSIPVITIDDKGRITSATTNAVAGVTGYTYTPANSTFIITTGAGSTFPATITTANDSVDGVIKVVDSVSNVSIYVAASANSVKTAYDNATTAYSNAATYADNKAANAYSNAVSYAGTIAGTAYSNATTFASSAAATAYSNAVSAASSSAATAYSNATTFAANATNISSGTLAELRLPFRMDQNVRTNDSVSFGNMTITGNLTVTGTTVTVNANNLSIQDNMIYLNSNSSITNPDLGIAGNYNDGTYRHAGFFRDASDGVWKVFDQYLPEPDASPYIDTANASFRIANFQANVVTAASFSGNGASVTSVNAATVGGNTAGTLRSYSDSTAATAYSNATSYAATIAGTAYSNATSYAATIAGTAYTNATSFASSAAATAYSNATSYASSIAATAYSNAVSYFTTNSANSAIGITYNIIQNTDLNGTGTTNALTSFNVYFPSGGGYNQPVGGGQHFRILQFGRYNTTDSNYWRGQIAQSFYEDRMWFRKEHSTTWGSWQELWHTGNDGSGSGLDADLLDGNHASAFMSASASTFSGDAANIANITNRVDSGFYNHDTATTAEGWPINDGAWQHMLSCTHSNDSNYYAMQLGASFYNNNLYQRNTQGSGSTGWNLIWTTGNDGSGSGLDADLWDGYNFSDYLNQAVKTNSTPTFYQASFTQRIAVGNGTAPYLNTGTAGIWYSNGGGASHFTGSHDSDNSWWGIYTSSAWRAYLTGSGNWVVGGDVRAPIFYDSANTSFYVDSASTSNINVLQAVGTIWTGYHGGTAYNGGSGASLYFGGDTAGAYRLWTQLENINGNYTKLNIDWHTGIKIGAYWNYGGIRFYDDAIGYGSANGHGNKVFSVAEGDTGVRAYYSMHAPIYYDSANTSFFVDPASRSRLSTVDLGNSGYYMTQGDWGWRHQTPDGWIQFGPANSGHAHIYTDRSNFYFNVNTLYTNGNLVWTSANDGSGSSLDADLLDGYNLSSSASGSTVALRDGSARLYTHLGEVNKNNDWVASFQATPVSGYTWHGDISTGGPTGTWWFYESMRHSNSGNYWGTQIAWGWEDNANQLYQRNVTGNSWSGWVKYWNSGNDGSGTGLDADLWDGYQFADYLNQAVKTNSSPSFSGLTVTANKFLLNSDSGGYGQLQINSPNTSTEATIVFGSGGSGQNSGGYTYAGVIGLGAYGLSKANFYFGAGYNAPAMFIPNSSAHAEATNSFRAPIFYDSANTSFYVDSASTSNINVLQAVGTIWTGYHGGTAYNGGSGASLYFGGDTAGAYRLWTQLENINGNYTKLNIDWHTGIKIGAYWNYGGIRFYDDAIGYGSANGHGNKVFSVAEGDTGVRAYYSMHAPIYYDSANTSFFVDPASRSRLSTVDLGNSGYYMTQGDWGWRHQTPDGWIQFGPANSGHAHIYTDRSNFYFNVNTLYTNGNLVWTSANDGSGSSLDADLLDGYNLSSSASGSTVALRDGSARLYTHLGEVNKNNDWVASFQATPVSGYTWHGDISTGGPTGTWWFYESMRHSNSGNYWGTQIAWGWEDNANQLYQRNVTGNSWSGWVKYWNSGNDGSGTGLDADLWDGYQFADYLNQAVKTDSSPSFNAVYSLRTGYAPNGDTATLEGATIVNYGMTQAYLSSFGGLNTVIAGYSGLALVTSSLKRLSINGSGNITAAVDLRAPIFYDSNDTSYYLNPNSQSSLHSATCWSTWYFRSNRNTSSSDPPLQAYSDDSGGAIMSFHRGGYYAVNFGLDSDNVMRIGGWSAAANRWQLDMSGNMTVAGNVTAYSDIRLKTDIQVIENAIEKVKQIRGVTFKRIDEGSDGMRQTGVIAQEVELVLPEAVSQDNEGIKNVAYGNMVGLLIEAIKEQQKQIEELKAALLNK